MVTSLSAAREEFVAALVASGKYKSRDEVLSEAVRLLREREEKRETLRGDIEAAIQQIENGGTLNMTPPHWMSSLTN